jgi:type II secretory pathway pseudopilin PulG
MSTSRAASRLTSSKKNKKSFTLLETIFAITIIGILLAIFLPTMSAIKLSAQKVKDQSNLKKIAEAWKTYTVDYGLKIKTGGASFMEAVAGGYWHDTYNTEHVLLNDPYVYVSPNDKYASKVVKEPVMHKGADGTSIYSESYTRQKNDLTATNNGIVISYCTITGLEGNIPLNTTPIAFTRGLQENGTWNATAGLYGDKGGYVVYGDGHVTWFDGSKPAKFLKWDGSDYTSDMRQALPTGTRIENGGAPSNMNQSYCDKNGVLMFMDADCIGTP